MVNVLCIMYACMHRAVVTRSPREYRNHVCCALGQHTANRRRKCTQQSGSCLWLCQIFSDFTKKFTHRLNNKSFLIWLSTTPPHLKYVPTLPCNLSLTACFADINQGHKKTKTHTKIAFYVFPGRPNRTIAENCRMRGDIANVITHAKLCHSIHDFESPNTSNFAILLGLAGRSYNSVNTATLHRDFQWQAYT